MGCGSLKVCTKYGAPWRVGRNRLLGAVRLNEDLKVSLLFEPVIHGEERILPNHIRARSKESARECKRARKSRCFFILCLHQMAEHRLFLAFKNRQKLYFKFKNAVFDLRNENHNLSFLFKRSILYDILK